MSTWKGMKAENELVIMLVFQEKYKESEMRGKLES